MTHPDPSLVVRRPPRPELAEDEDLCRAPAEARPLFIGLVTVADDGGRVPLVPDRLARLLFPDDPTVDGARVTAWLKQLEEADLLDADVPLHNGSYIYLSHFGWFRGVVETKPARTDRRDSVAEIVRKAEAGEIIEAPRVEDIPE